MFMLLRLVYTCFLVNPRSWNGLNYLLNSTATVSTHVLYPTQHRLALG